MVLLGRVINIGVIKRVSEHEYQRIKNEIFPNDEIMVENTDVVHWAYQKLPNWTMRIHYKDIMSPYKYSDEVEYLNSDEQERFNNRLNK